MNTRVRKYGEAEFHDVEHNAGDCAFCEAARYVRWNGAPGVVFLENDAGVIHRVEALSVAGALVLACQPFTAEQADAELGTVVI